MDIANDFQENYGNGWIKLYRSIKNHWILPKNTPRTNFEAWLIMLLEVNHSGQKVQIGYDIIECNRGESLYSLDTWAKLFNWHKSKVRRFFKMLEKDSMIVLNECQKTTHLTICNYELYQGDRNASETQVKRKRNASETQVTPNNNDKNVNNDKNIDFDVFWNLYDYKKDKKKTELKWNKLKKETQQEIIDKLPEYIKSTPDKKFRKHPSTYLNNESWKDEIEIKKSIEERYLNHYNENKSNENSKSYAYLLKQKKDILYKFDDIITIDEFSKLKLNGNLETIIISFQNYGKSKDEFLTNLGIHVRKY